MNCDKYENLMNQYIDGELYGDLKDDFEQHISGCQLCRKKLDALTQIVYKLNNIEEEELPDTYHSEVMNKIAVTENKKRFYNFSKAFATAACFIILISAGGVFLKNTQTAENIPKSNIADEDFTDAPLAAPFSAETPSTRVRTADNDISSAESDINSNDILAFSIDRSQIIISKYDVSVSSENKSDTESKIIEILKNRNIEYWIDSNVISARVFKDDIETILDEIEEKAAIISKDISTEDKTDEYLEQKNILEGLYSEQIKEDNIYEHEQKVQDANSALFRFEREADYPILNLNIIWFFF